MPYKGNPQAISDLLGGAIEIICPPKLERPKTRNRAVFVRHVAPREQPVGPDLFTLLR